jgi:hypothetical protein
MSGKRRKTTSSLNQASLESTFTAYLESCLGPEFDCLSKELRNNRKWLIQCCKRWGVSQELLQAGYPIKKTPSEYPSEVLVSFFNFECRWVILIEVLAKACEAMKIDSTPLFSYRDEAADQKYQKTESFKQATATLQRLRIKLQQVESGSPNSQEYKNTPRHSPDPSHPTNEDGPTPPNHFHCKGKVYDFPPIQWKILNYMWHKDTAPINDIIDAVWGRDDIKTPTFNQAVHKLTTKMSEYKLPYTFNTKDGYLTKTSY